MTRRTWPGFGVGCAVTLTVLGCVRSGTGDVDGSATEAIADTIAHRWGEYRESLARGDAPALAAMFTDDAMLMELGTATLRGRAAIERFVGGAFARAARTEVTNSTAELTVHDDRAYEFGTFDDVGSGLGAPPGGHGGQYFVVWRRSGDGAWRIHRMMAHGLLARDSS